MSSSNHAYKYEMDESQESTQREKEVGKKNVNTPSFEITHNFLADFEVEASREGFFAEL